MAQTFLALVAALNESSGLERTVRFIIDILATQLHGVDLSEIWNVQNPMNYLTKVLQMKGLAEPESRLLWCSGKETIFSCYHVGIYSNKELIGQGNKPPNKKALFCFFKHRLFIL
jgi:large subunit ribosomal protein L44